MFSFRIAFRYLFSKKEHNVVNIISFISAGGICVGSLALVFILSVYNGFEALVQDMFGAFDPDLKITLVEGKTFDLTLPEMQKVKAMDEVAVFSPVLEENALVKNQEKQQPAVVKGVSDNFSEATSVRSLMIAGDFLLHQDSYAFAIPGAGLAAYTEMNVNFLNPITLYAPKRTGKVNIANPENSFTQESMFVSGVFSVKQVEYDDNYVLVPLQVAQRLFEYDANQVSAVELKLHPTADVEKVQRAIQQQLPTKFLVQNKYEQQGEFFRIMKVEKWITFLILAFILLIAIFNVIGSLSMLMVEKQNDIVILSQLGASREQIRQIFLYEGWLVAVLGSLLGIVLGVVLCWVQMQFGIIQLQGNTESYVISAYPVQLQCLDLLYVFVTVLILSFVSVYYTTRQLDRKMVKSE